MRSGRGPQDRAGHQPRRRHPAERRAGASVSSTSAPTPPACSSPRSTTAGSPSSSGAPPSPGSARASRPPAGSPTPPIARVCEALAVYREVIDRLGADEVVAVATSAMRDAENGPAFRDEIRERFGIDARTISGDEEARLTFLGATSGRAGRRRHARDRHRRRQHRVRRPGGPAATPASTSPPAWARCATPSATCRATRPPPTRWPRSPRTPAPIVSRGRSRRTCASASRTGIAVAGTATTLAAIAQELDPYDPEKVHGYRLGRGTCERIVSQLAALTVDARRRVTGLHPDRAPTHRRRGRRSCSNRCAPSTSTRSKSARPTSSTAPPSRPPRGAAS